MDIDWNKFSVVVFIDSNVVLECLALEQLPWREVHNTGPILVLVTPTVLQEVDSKKNHHRLGDHARRFNRSMRALLAENATEVIRQAPNPQVDVALAVCTRVDWEKYPYLDPDEPDSRVVAQALTARGPSLESRIIVSHDIRPLTLAQQHGLRIFHIGDNWLRPKDKSEAEKRANSLKREIDEIRSRQPKLALSLSTSKDNVSVHRILDLSSQEREAIQDTIFRLHPMPEQAPDFIGAYNLFGQHDHTLSTRYKRWEEKVIPQFVRDYERKLELNFGHVEIVFRIENIGQVPADSLLIHLSIKGGWFNDRYVIASPAGPRSPGVRNPLFSHPHLPNHLFRPVEQRGKHDFVVQRVPARTAEVQISCSDFRHGYDYEYRMIGWVDPRADDFHVEAVVTAANLYGEIREAVIVEKTIIESSVFDLVDPETMKFHKLPEIVELLSAAKSNGDFSNFEFDGNGWDK
ncbi:MAG: PIN domain-containing protein [Pseudomonadota bacterium]